MGTHVVVQRLMAPPNSYSHVTDSTYNRAPLVWVVANGQDAVAELLLAHPDTDLNEGSSVMEIPLLLAISCRHRGVVRLLLDRADAGAAIPGRCERERGSCGLASRRLV
jgi:ankyrin repeat protein